MREVDTPLSAPCARTCRGVRKPLEVSPRCANQPHMGGLIPSVSQPAPLLGYATVHVTSVHAHDSVCSLHPCLSDQLNIYNTPRGSLYSRLRNASVSNPDPCCSVGKPHPHRVLTSAQEGGGSRGSIARARIGLQLRRVLLRFPRSPLFVWGLSHRNLCSSGGFWGQCRCVPASAIENGA
jgi:hypothetical protein